ncbi:proliferating cell nuclear antigen, N-terminal domain-containing protein, partial [Baffinella frigidus]
MFEARMAQGSVLKKLIDSIRELVSDANFEVSSDGFELQAMDTSHVCLVSLMMRDDGFEHYRCDRSRTLGINLPSLQKVIKCAGNDDSITLKAQDEGDILTLTFENPNADRITDFDLKLLDIDCESLSLPNTDYKATLNAIRKQKCSLCRSLLRNGVSGTVLENKTLMSFPPQGDKDEQQTMIELEEPVSLNFALKYLNMFVKATPLSETVTLAMSPDTPLVLVYKVGDMGHIRYFLAPKIDE